VLEHPDRAAAFDAGPLWMRILPPVAMFAMGLWRITGPSYWRDEAATMTAVQRPFPEVLRMMGNVDAVHGVYYMIIWVVVRLGGAGELVTRLPSAVAMACAAAAVAALGRRVVSPRAGLAAGLLLAALPQISLYAQDAREYAAVTALAAAGSYLLVRALAAAAGAFLLASPILALGIAQRGTLSWITTPPLLGTIEGLRKLVGPATMVLAPCLAIALGVAADALARRPLRASRPPELLALCLPWLLLLLLPPPPAVLIGVSYVSPVTASPGRRALATIAFAFLMLVPWLPASVIRARLGHIRRLWLVEFGPRPHLRLLDGLGFRLLRRWRPSEIWLLLYARSGQVARFR
jgi:4-amino-4-deoxy-L-arabinose transferase-like glycosyltransferase